MGRPVPIPLLSALRRLILLPLFLAVCALASAQKVSGLTVAASVTGGANAGGRVTISEAAKTGGFVVKLSSSKTAAVPPASVTVAAGAKSANFTVMTTAVSADATAVITATGGGASATASLQILAPVLTGLTVAPGSVTGSQGATGRVSLSGVAPTGGETVTLSSDNSAATTLGSVKVPAGARNANFAVITQPVSAAATANISATLGAVTETATISVLPPVLTAVTVAPAQVYGGQNANGRVTLNFPAPTGGETITLQSSASYAVPPTSVTVAAGARTAAFAITTSAVSTSGTATITATMGTTTETSTLQVMPPIPRTLRLTPATVFATSTVTGTVTLNVAAPTGGTPVTLTSDSAFAPISANPITVAAGATQATFAIVTTPVTKDSVANISAAAGGTTITSKLNVTFIAVASVALTPTKLYGGTNVAGLVTLAEAPPAGGAVVALTSSDPSVTVPVTVTVGAGALTARFAGTTTVQPSNKTVTVSAALATTTGSATVTVFGGGLDQSGAAGGRTAWPKFHGNLMNTGNAGTALQNSGLGWTFNPLNGGVSSPVTSSPAVDSNGQIYVGSWDGSIYDLSASSGSVVWSVATGGPVRSSPVLGGPSTNEALYIGSDDGKLYAVKVSTGAVLWTFQTGGPIEGSAAVGADGNVYFGSRDGKVYAVNQQTGAQDWFFTTGAGVSSSPTLDSTGDVYIGSDDGSLYAISCLTGTRKWAFRTKGVVRGCPAYVSTSGTLYVGSADGNLYSVTAATGALIGSFTALDSIYSSPVIGPDGTVWIGSDDFNEYGLNPTTLKTVYSLKTGDAIEASVGVDSLGDVAVASFDGKLYVLQPNPTSAGWIVQNVFNLNTPLFSSPVVQPGTFVLGTETGGVVAVQGGG